jgi:hypothetical protein
MYFELKSNLTIIKLAKKAKLNHYSFDGIWVHWKGNWNAKNNIDEERKNENELK